VSRAVALIVLVACVAALGVAVAYEVVADVGGSSDPVAVAARKAASESDAKPAALPSAVDPADLGKTILQRPLFASGRRPPSGSTTTAPLAVSGGAAELPRLTGIIIDENTKIAIFQPKDAGKPIAVAEGQDIAGRKIASIEPEEIVLDGPEGEQHLSPIPDPTLEQAVAAMAMVAEPPIRAQPGRRPGLPRQAVDRPGLRRPQDRLPGPIRGRRPGEQIPGRPPRNLPPDVGRGQ
jgi:hypothetical protein